MKKCYQLILNRYVGKTQVLKTDGSLMHVESIAVLIFIWHIFNTFDLH